MKIPEFEVDVARPKPITTAECEIETLAQRHKEAQKTSQRRWDAAEPASPLHPYLVRKRIQPHGIRQDGDLLLVPVFVSKELASLQTIGPSGKKLFLPGGKVRAGFLLLGQLNSDLVICEGFATAASIHEATRKPVVVAFNASNLVEVAKRIRNMKPKLALTIAGDDDHGTEGNTGRAKAKEAAAAVGARLVMPKFTDEQKRNGCTDFNDLSKVAGVDCVRDQFNATDDADEIVPATVAIRRVSDIESKPVDWLWHGFVARGKVCMIAGNPGLGKSQVSLCMASIVSHGGRWPANTGRAPSGAVLLLSAEDDVSDTIKPRLEAAGADVTRIHVLEGVFKEDSDGQKNLRPVDLCRDVERLRQAINSIGAVALVVIDPITAYLGSTDSHKNAEVRALLAPLSDMAADCGVAVVCVSHLNKSGGAEALMRVSGSLAFVAAARAAFIVAKDSNDPDRRLFLPAKNNLGKDQFGFAYRIAEHKNTDGISAPRIEWEPDPVEIDASEALDQSGSEEKSAIDEAMDWLDDLLSGGPVKAKQVKIQAAHDGIAWRTVRRASESLAVIKHKDGFAGGWVWELEGPNPAKVSKNAEDAQHISVGTFEDFGHLRGDSSSPQVGVSEEKVPSIDPNDPDNW